MIRLLPILFIIIGCSSEWHLKKAIKKDPELLTRPAIVRTYLDSMLVVTEGSQAETTFYYIPTPVDTFILEKERFKTVVVKDTVLRTIQVDTECYPDTVWKEYVKTEYKLQPVIDTRSKWEKFTSNFGEWFFWLIVVVGVIVAVRFWVRG